MTSPTNVIRVAKIGSDGKLFASVIPADYPTRSNVTAMISEALAGFTGGSGGAVPTDIQQQLDARLRVTAAAGFIDSIEWIGPSWPPRPATRNRILWIGGPSQPPRTGSYEGGGGMAPKDFWLATPAAAAASVV